jgi:hypothetical protein
MGMELAQSFITKANDLHVVSIPAICECSVALPRGARPCDEMTQFRLTRVLDALSAK